MPFDERDELVIHDECGHLVRADAKKCHNCEGE